MIEVVSMFKTADGKTFATEEEATIHANRGQFSERADRFIKAYEWNRGRDTAARNIVLKFLSFEAIHGSDGPVPVAEVDDVEYDEETDVE
jgi:hypothetical protein